MTAVSRKTAIRKSNKRNNIVQYPLKFRAAVLERHNEPLVIDEVTFNGPLEAGQVLVRIHYSGVCGKQIEEIKGSGEPDPFLPHMLGHEGSGIVMDVGPGVRKVKPGDHVVLHWMKGSGIDAVTPLYNRKGVRVNAGWITTFNEYGVISENRMTVIPEGSDLSVACLLGCAVTTGVGAVFHQAKVCPGEAAAVFGCGGVGLNCIQGAAMVHAHPIIAVDTNPKNLKLAKTLGATHFINAHDEDVLARVKEITNGMNARYVFIVTAAPSAIEQGIEASSIPGSVYFVSVPPFGTKISVDALSIHRRRQLFGSFGGGSFPDRDVPACLALYERGLLKLNELVSIGVSLDDINKGIEELLMEKGGRCIVRMANDKR
ncbi:MAG: zinc-binding dehydrogenase [Candidatus Omnitrophica bacterium]|nr:zinc-binding dehydrogenase [Candidatus Omnitrophota bacterium]